MVQNLSFFSSSYFSYKDMSLEPKLFSPSCLRMFPPVVHSKSKYIFELYHWLQTFGNVKLGVDNEVDFFKGVKLAQGGSVINRDFLYISTYRRRILQIQTQPKR